MAPKRRPARSAPVELEEEERPVVLAPKTDIYKRFTVGVALFVTLLLPMRLSSTYTRHVLTAAAAVASLEWVRAALLLSQASALKKLVAILMWLVWIVPAIWLLVQPEDVLGPDAELSWPGHRRVVETLAVVLIVSDTAQLLVGRKLGGRVRPFPHISPKKTLEGYLGGLILAFLLGKLALLPDWPDLALAAALVFGVVGDLYFSLAKRVLDIKDFSNILGPHGGLCDRIDSFVGAIYALYLCGDRLAPAERRAWDRSYLAAAL